MSTIDFRNYMRTYKHHLDVEEENKNLREENERLVGHMKDLYTINERLKIKLEQSYVTIEEFTYALKEFSHDC